MNPASAAILSAGGVPTFAELRGMIGERLAGMLDSESTVRLDIFLMAAGLEQVLADHRSREVALLPAVSRRLRRTERSGARRAAVAADALEGVARRVRATTVEAALPRRHAELAQLVQRLAGTVAIPPTETLAAEVDRLLAKLGQLPEPIQRTVMVLPQCFFSFDQRPQDCRMLAEAFSQKWPDRNQPVTVVGIRTSGSYLSPLTAAYLTAQGYRDVVALTWRSGQSFDRRTRDRLRRTWHNGGHVIITDDPPTSGRSLTRLAQVLLGLGAPARAIVPLIQTFEGPAWWSWQTRLATYEPIVLPWTGWTIQQRLDPTSAQQALSRLLIGKTVRLPGAGEGRQEVCVGAVSHLERMRPLPSVPGRQGRTVRGHARALYEVTLTDRITGGQFQHRVYAKGLGLGYFAGPERLVSERLAPYVPRSYGIVDGVLYREWLPEEWRKTRAPDTMAPAAVAIASYVARRGGALPLEGSRPRWVEGRDGIGQRCADLLSPGFGRAAPLARRALRRTFEAMVTPGRRSFIDGDMLPAHWFLEPGSGRLLKVHPAEDAFWSGAVFCEDPLYDLACAAVNEAEEEGSGRPGAFETQLRAAYAPPSGERIDETRWVLYQLLSLRQRRLTQLHAYALREGQGHTYIDDAVAAALGPWERQMTAALDRFLSRALRGTQESTESGPLCAIDLDGVFYSGTLGFPAASPAGVLALRALAGHGFRVALASGRSLGEVRAAVDTYRLAGGVAEYGAATYDRRTGRSQVLIDRQQQAGLATIRDALRQVNGVIVDGAFDFIVRAYTVRGQRRAPLSAEVTSRAILEAGPAGAFQVTVGASQTDILPAAVDKRHGLRALAAELEPGHEFTLALAVGDSASDLGMLEEAGLACAPANADPAVRNSARTVGGRLRLLDQAFQSGLLAAVSGLVGHQPGRCPACRPSPPPESAQRLLVLLAAQDRSRWGKLSQLLGSAGPPTVTRAPRSVL